MIRQHFYPKSYFRHRSLGKGSCKADSLMQENCQTRSPNEAEFNQIKFKRNKQVLRQQPESFYLNDQTASMQGWQKPQPTHKQKVSSSKIQTFIQQQAHSQFCSQHQTTVLRQIHNHPFKQSLHQQQKIKQSPNQNDIKNLFVKSDRKQIVKANRNSYRVLGHSNSQNQSLLIDTEWVKMANRTKSSSRKLSSADASHRCYRKSIQRKKKKDRTPAQIIISASLSTVQVPNNKPTVFSQRLKQPPVFEKITQNLISLNLSKAIKYRQSSMQQKIRRQRKNSQKISLQNIQNRTYDLEQKVKGWEILVQDDVDFS